MITRKYYKLIRVSYADSDLFRITNISDQLGTLTITGGGGTLKYSLDGVDFTTYDFTTRPTISVPAGGNCYMKGAKSNPTSNQLHFSMDVNHSIGGNIMSIVDETNYTTMTSIPNYAFHSLFNNDTHLIDASQLNFGNAKTVGSNGMYTMFGACSSLQTAPDLSNITTCTSSSLQATFMNCTSLVSLPDITNIETIGNQTLQSFGYGCSSVSTAYAPNISTWTNTGDWLRGVAASGTVYCPSQTVYDNITSGYNGVPSGWTKQMIQ